MTKRFILRGTKKEKTIYLRIREGIKVDCKVSTGLKIEDKYWDKSKGAPKDVRDESSYSCTFFEDKLRDIINSVREYEVGEGKNRVIDRVWLEAAVAFKSSSQNSERVLIIKQLDIYKNRISTRIQNGRIGVSAGTLRNYDTTISRLNRFENYVGHQYSLEELSFSFHDEYLKYAQNNLELAANSIGKDIKNIKAMCSDASDRGLDVNKNVFSKRFSVPTEKTEFVVLSVEELQLLFEFKGPDYLMNANRWLLIGSWTGARVNDLMKFTNKNLVNYGDSKVIKYTQSKTEKVVRLAIHPHVESILSENDWSFPRPISDVKFNEYIKEVCRVVGINAPSKGTAFDEKTKKRKKGIYPKWKLVRSHTCRRSFASNHYGKVPTVKIMAATGHSTEKMLLNYIGETEEDHIDDFIGIWKK